MLGTRTGKTWSRRQLLNTLFSLVGINVGIAGLSFITTMLIANALGKKSFGDLSFGVAVGTYGLMFTQYGLEKSFVRDLVHFPKRVGELVKASLILKSMLFVLFLFFLFVGVCVFSKRGELSWAIVLVIFGTVLPAFQPHGLYDAWREMRRHAIYQMIERCTYFAFVWFAIFVPLFTLSLSLIAGFIVLSVVFGIFLQYRWALPRIDFRPVRGTWASIILIIRSNTWIWLAVLSGLSIDYLTQIILKFYAGSSELGLYSVAWKISQFGTLFLVQAGRIGAEATARQTVPGGEAIERRRFLRKYVALMGALGLLLGLPCILLPEQILKTFLPEYANASQMLRLLGLYPLLYGPYLAVLQYVVSMRMQRTYFTLITVAGFVSMGLNFWLVPQMQGIGSAISAIGSLALALFLFTTAVGLHFRNQIKPVTRKDRPNGY